MKHQPTEEQKAGIDLAMSGTDLKVQALAGCGKTTFLEMVGSAKNEKGDSGVYVSFSKAIVEDAAGRFTKNVTCSTAHALAFRAVGIKFKHRLNGERQRYADVAEHFRIQPAEGSIEGTDINFSETEVVHNVLQTVNRFCLTGDMEFQNHHCPVPELFSAWSKEFRAVFAPRFIKLAKEFWSDINSRSGFLRFTHNHYLKIWQLTDPTINGEFIMFDECQDANGVMLAIVENQRHAQKIWVGDSHQQIYSWNGAVNALQRIKSGVVTHLSESWRFGPQVAEIANLILERLGAEVLLKGRGPDSTIGRIAQPKARLFRGNAACMSAMFEAHSRGFDFHLVGGTDEIAGFVQGAKRLMEGRKPNHPELNPFGCWNDVLLFCGTTESEDGNFTRLVKSIETLGCQKILNICRSANPEEHEAELIISTAHKSKGRQWESVCLGSDFPESTNDEELRLLYVAATRAMRELDYSGCHKLFHPDQSEG